MNKLLVTKYKGNFFFKDHYIYNVYVGGSENFETIYQPYILGLYIFLDQNSIPTSYKMLIRLENSQKKLKFV